MSGKIQVFDTTLRDGEQSPGATLCIDDKIEVARQLVRLGVDVIEAGFPAASPGDQEAVALIAREARGAAIAGLCRSTRSDIDTAWEALRHAEQPVIHVFISTSDLHIQHKLRSTRQQVLRQAVDHVRYARSLSERVEFSAEDASRTDGGFLCQVLEAVIDAGATVVNVPDTVGYSEPVEYGGLIRMVQERVPNIHRAVISVHCHDDLGMATANTLAGVREGAGQVEVTVNGVGERAGNTSIEEVVMALRTRPESFRGCYTDVRAEELVPTSRLVSRLMDIPVQPNKAVVGENAFAHEAGIHQDGYLKNPLTYEIMTPESVGWGSSRLVLGKHSGRRGFNARLAQLGFDLDPATLEHAYSRFICLADERKRVSEDDVITLIHDAMLARAG